jgi:hypothetical protein
VRFRNLVDTAQAALRSDHPGVPHEALLAPLRALEGDVEFWRHGAAGLAVFASASGVRIVRLPRPVPDVAVVAATFLVRPLLRIATWPGRFQVLSVTRRAVRLFEGDRDWIGEIPLAEGVPRRIEDAIAGRAGERSDGSGQDGPPAAAADGPRGRGGARTGDGDRRHGTLSDAIDPDVAHFFREVDRGVLEHHSRPSDLPLVLLGLPENLGPFRALSRNPARFETGIEVDPSSLDDATLRARAWAVIEVAERERIDALLERFGAAQARGAALDRLDPLGEAAAQGRIETLLIEAPPLPAEGSSGMADGEPVEAAVTDDALDALAEQVLRTGGALVEVPPGRLASPVRAAAILRY